MIPTDDVEAMLLDAFDIGSRAGYIAGVEASLSEMSRRRHTYKSARAAVRALLSRKELKFEATLTDLIRKWRRT